MPSRSRGKEGKVDLNWTAVGRFDYCDERLLLNSLGQKFDDYFSNFPSQTRFELILAIECAIVLN